jgi:predicted transcriptional regulator
MSGPRSLRVVDLGDQERATLEALTRRTTVAVGLVRRARMILLAADGMPLDRIAREVGADRTIVRTWVDRYRAGGLDGVRDRPRSGRPRTFSP